MYKIKCPCCGYYTHLVDNKEEPLHLFEICEVCFWQYDWVAHKEPDRIIGANHVSLNEARGNYKKYGVCKTKHVGKGYTRPPLPEELPENNE